MISVSVPGKSLKLQKGKESVKALKSQEQEKYIFADGKYIQEKEQRNITCGTKEKQNQICSQL